MKKVYLLFLVLSMVIVFATTSFAQMASEPNQSLAIQRAKLISLPNESLAVQGFQSGNVFGGINQIMQLEDKKCKGEARGLSKEPMKTLVAGGIVWISR